jgi:hypothetical protein
LALAADEPRLVRSLRRLVHRPEPGGCDRGRLPLQLERLEGVCLDRAAHELERRLADQDLARRRRLLQPGGDVESVSRGQALLRTGDHLAGVDPDPSLDPELGEGLAHLECGPAGADRIVLVDGRNAEDGHHRVADEFLDAAAVALDDRLHPPEVADE